MRILDLFAGTGSIGLEFYSRGAGAVVLVDINRLHTNFIRKTIDTLGANGAIVIQSNVKSYLKGGTASYDIIFADPPYDLHWLETIPSLIFESGLLKNDGLFILEHSREYNFNAHQNFLEHRHYGSVNFSFFS